MSSVGKQIKELLNELIVKFEKSPEKYILLASIYRQLGDSDKSLNILYKGLKTDHSNVSAKLMISEILYDRWFIDESRKYLEEVAYTSPDNKRASSMLYDIYISEEKYDKALDLLYQDFVFSDRKEELLDKINTLKSNLNPRPKISDISKNIRDKIKQDGQIPGPGSGNNVIITETMADIYINQGNYDKAVEILEELIVKNPDDIHLRTRLSLCQASRMYGKNFRLNKKEVS